MVSVRELEAVWKEEGEIEVQRGGGYREENGERNLDSADYRSFVIPGI